MKIVVQDSEDTMEVEATTRKFPGRQAAANQILTLISHRPSSLKPSKFHNTSCFEVAVECSINAIISQPP